MRKPIVLIFLAFYLAASTTATQHRTVRLANRVMHSAAQRADTQVSDWSKASDDGYPNYREARKGGSFHFIANRPLTISLVVVELEFPILSVSCESHCYSEIRSVRAPPAIA